MLPDNSNYAGIRQLGTGEAFINSYWAALTFRKIDISTTIDGVLSGTIGDMTWDGTAHLGNKLKFTNLDVTGGSIDNVNISTLTIPDNSLAITKISNLNSCLNSLSTNKQDDRPLTARTYISITESPSNNWTITAIAPGAEYSNKDNNIVINNADGTINLSTTIPTNNISFDIITASTGYKTSGNVSGIVLGYSLLESSYNHYAIGHVTNGRTFIISYGQILTFRKTDLTTNMEKRRELSVRWLLTERPSKAIH